MNGPYNESIAQAWFWKTPVSMDLWYVTHQNMWVLCDSVRLRILLAHSRWTLNVWLHFVTWQDQEVLHIVWHRHRSLHRTSTQICAFADTDLCTCVIFSCQSNAHDSLPATSRVPEMVSTPEEFCYNTFDVISVQKKKSKSSFLMPVSVFVCVWCLFHMNVLYICTRCVIVHQYLANIQTLIWVMPATLSSPGYWWCFCALQRQTLQVNKNIWVRNQNFGRCLLGGGGTGWL